MPISLTQDQLRQYKQDGVLFPITVLSPSETVKYFVLSNRLEELLGGKPKAIEMTQMHLSFRWAYELATLPNVLNAVEDILGPNILIWATSIFSKHPHDPGYVSWHQDEKYWGLDSLKVVSAWIALTSSSIENGCMRVIAGSQQEALLPHTETFSKNNLLTRGQEIAVNPRDEEIKDVLLKPGEMSLHNIRIIHGSNPNCSSEKRVGFVVRYIAPSVRQIGQYPKAILVRGSDLHRNFDLVDAPVETSMEESLANQRELAQQFLNAVAASHSKRLKTS